MADANGNQTNALEYAYLNALPGTVAQGSRAIDSHMETTVQLQNPALTSTTDQQQDEQGADVGNANPEAAPAVAPGDAAGDNPADQHLTDDEGTPLTDHSAQVPNAPTTVTAVAGAAGHAVVSWAAPVDADGYGITAYTVTATSSDGGAGPVTAAFGNVLTGNVAGLTSAKHYTFTVKATNIAGVGPNSAASASLLIG